MRTAREKGYTTLPHCEGAHGRNWKRWWRHKHKDEPYDYLYRPPEIQESANHRHAEGDGQRRVQTG